MPTRRTCLDVPASAGHMPSPLCLPLLLSPSEGEVGDVGDMVVVRWPGRRGRHWRSNRAALHAGAHTRPDCAYHLTLPLPEPSPRKARLRPRGGSRGTHNPEGRTTQSEGHPQSQLIVAWARRLRAAGCERGTNLMFSDCLCNGHPLALIAPVQYQRRPTRQRSLSGDEPSHFFAFEKAYAESTCGRSSRRTVILNVITMDIVIVAAVGVREGHANSAGSGVQKRLGSHSCAALSLQLAPRRSSLARWSYFLMAVTFPSKLVVRRQTSIGSKRQC